MVFSEGDIETAFRRAKIRELEQEQARQVASEDAEKAFIEAAAVAIFQNLAPHEWQRDPSVAAASCVKAARALWAELQKSETEK